MSSIKTTNKITKLFYLSLILICIASFDACSLLPNSELNETFANTFVGDNPIFTWNDGKDSFLRIMFDSSSYTDVILPENVSDVDALYCENDCDVYAFVTDKNGSSHIVKLSFDENGSFQYTPLAYLGTGGIVTDAPFDVTSLIKNGEDFFFISADTYYKYTSDRYCVFNEKNRTFSDQVKANNKIYLLSHQVNEENVIIQSSVFEVIPNGVAEDFDYHEIWIRDSANIIGFLSADENKLTLIDSMQQIHTIELTN